MYVAHGLRHTKSQTSLNMIQYHGILIVVVVVVFLFFEVS